MNLRLAFAGTIFLATGLMARADWSTLLDANGQVVEVAVDFRITQVKFAPDGTVTLIATASENGRPIGFSIAIERPKREVGADVSLPTRSGIDIRSIGAATQIFEELLDAQLKGQEGFHGGRLEIVGLYSAWLLDNRQAFPEERFTIHGTSVGITHDNVGGNRIGDCYELDLVIDAPMGRLIAYVSAPPGFGGTPRNHLARQKWLESKEAGLSILRSKTQDGK